MADIVTALTDLAVSVFRSKADDKSLAATYNLITPDSVLQEAYRLSFMLLHLVPSDTVTTLFFEGELSSLGHHEGELDPMFLHPGGGRRMRPIDFILGLLSSAFLQIYFLRLPADEGVFVRKVLEGHDQLCRAVRGEPVLAHRVTGIAGVTLPEGTQVKTPWGVLRPAPPVSSNQWVPPVSPMGSPDVTCTFAEQLFLSVKFDRASNPPPTFSESDMPLNRSRILFPLACALASTDSKNLSVPLITWSTTLLPFSYVFSCTWSNARPAFRLVSNLGENIAELEEWADIVDRAHTPSLEIAAGRLVSSAAYRMDRSDALIDAVMVWENLVGPKSETTFRVTAALSKLLESDPAGRRKLRQSLGKIYDIRSQVVHGVKTDKVKIDKACSEAIDVAVRVLRISYQKGPGWLSLSSNERADTILLEWP